MEILEKSISDIFNNEKLIEKLNNIQIETISDLTNYSQKELSDKNIENLYIKDIIITLQSNGLDLKKNRKRK